MAYTEDIPPDPEDDAGRGFLSDADLEADPNNRHVSQRLPRELVAEILEFACFSGGDSLQVSATEIITTPTIYSHVSSSWRQVAIDSPRLWTSFNVDVYQIPTDISTLLDRHLNNAGLHPLRMTIRDSGPCDHSSYPTGDTGLEQRLGPHGSFAFLLLLKAVHRCCELYTYFEDSLLSAVNPSSRPDIVLPFLRLFDSNTTRPFTNHWFCDPFAEAPKLKQAYTTFSFNPLPYHQLTSIAVGEMPCMDLCQILPGCRSLEKLSVWVTPSGLGSPAGTAPTVLPNLKIVSLTLESCLDTISSLLETVTVPSLNFLEIYSLDNSLESWDLSPYYNIFQSWIERSSCAESLHQMTLRFSGCFYTSTSLEGLLGACPYLENLEIAWNHTLGGIYLLGLLERLTIPEVSSGQPPLLPHVRELFIEDGCPEINGMPIDPSIILALAESRSRRGLRVREETNPEAKNIPSLHRLDVSFCTRDILHPLKEADMEISCMERLDAQTLQRFRALNSEGTHCTVDWPEGTDPHGSGLAELDVE
ncbi:hypothetical protein VNI00_003659 [Paramarasmius palmivorus]|uniref:F-box domain-containing protein n=1 Tax=Paramarasmius palmivorus TaxID=297713 RepID=A0AAW0DRI6_9AGAR